MSQEFTDEELAAEIERLEKLETLCDRYGEADGGDVCRSHLRALRLEQTDRATR